MNKKLILYVNRLTGTCHTQEVTDEQLEIISNNFTVEILNVQTVKYEHI